MRERLRRLLPPWRMHRPKTGAMFRFTTIEGPRTPRRSEQP